jgi:hypothetical protein
MSIEQIEKINFNRPECLYCKSICEADTGGEAMMVMTTYDCKLCGDYFTIVKVASDKELSFTCKEFCIFHYNDANEFEVDNTDGLTHDRIKIPVFDIDFSDRERLYEKLKTYLIFA